MDKSYQVISKKLQSGKYNTLSDKKPEFYQVGDKWVPSFEKNHTIVRRQAKYLLQIFPNLGFNITECDYIESQYGQYYHVFRYPEIFDIRNHFFSKKSISLKPFKYSKLLIIDVDQRSQQEGVSTISIVEKVREIFGTPFYIERNKLNYHIYIQTDSYMNKNIAGSIQNDFKLNFNYVIEVIHPDRYIKLPASYDYKKEFGFYDEKKKYKIGKFRRGHRLFNLKRLFSDRSTSVRKLPKKYRIEGTPLASFRLSINQLFDDNSIPQSHFDKFFTYGSGTRHEKQILIGFFCLRKKFGFSKFVDMCIRCNDGTSKDMKKINSVTTQSMLKNIWKWCQEKYIPSSVDAYDTVINPNKLYYNNSFELLPEDHSALKEGLESAYDIIYSSTHQKIYKKSHINSCIKLYTWILQKRFYNLSRKWTYKKERFKILNDGVNMSIDLLLNKIKKELDISNPRKCLNTLKLVNLITPIPIEIGEKKKYISNYSYKFDIFSIHYYVSTISSWKEYADSKFTNRQSIEIVHHNHLNSFYQKFFMYSTDVINYYKDKIANNTTLLLINTLYTSISINILYSSNTSLIDSITGTFNSFFTYNNAVKVLQTGKKELTQFKRRMETFIDYQGNLSLTDRLMILKAA